MGNASHKSGKKKSFVVVPPQRGPKMATYDGAAYAEAVSPKNNQGSPPVSPVLTGEWPDLKHVESFETLDDDDESPRDRLGRKKSELKANSSLHMQAMQASKEENYALIFIKPAVSHLQSVRDVIDSHLQAHGCELTSEGTLTAETIASKGIIDKHYSALASSAMSSQPFYRKLDPALEADFKEKFGVDYNDGKGVLSLKQFMDLYPKFSVHQIDAAWAAGARLKLAGGLYVGRLTQLETKGQAPILVINGFYAAMRSEYVTPGKVVVYFTCEWKSKDLSWKDFREKVIGATDPSKALPSSLRARLFREWKELGIKEPPSLQNNCVHASAGPFEAIQERVTWIGMDLEHDPFARLLKEAGVPLDWISLCCSNKSVTVRGKTGPAFDIFEDTDSFTVVEIAEEMLANSEKSPF